MLATCEWSSFNQLDEYDYECDDRAVGYFDGFFYCEYHARRLDKIR